MRKGGKERKNQNEERLPGFEKVFLGQPIADRLALNLEIIFNTFSTNQNSVHRIYD